MDKVQSGCFTLNDEQRHFKDLVDSYLRFVPYWEFDDRSVDLDAIERDIGMMSHWEQIMLRFFVALWVGETRDFDFIDAVKTLDYDQLPVITNWLKVPVFPRELQPKTTLYSRVQHSAVLIKMI